MKSVRTSNIDRKRLTLCILVHPATISALVALALTALLYGNALALPLFSDDLVQIPWLESISWREMWTNPSPYGYYRPVWYSLWRVWGWLFGGLRPFGLHLLNVIAHFAASWLAGLLAATWLTPAEPEASPSDHEPAKAEEKIRVHPRSSASLPACIAAALFAAFPFARQAVAWPGAVYNPLVSAMAAGALLAYDRGRRCDEKCWIGLALLLAALSALTYEAGLLVAPLVVMAEIVGSSQRRWPHRWGLASVAAFIAVFAATFWVWRAMRGAGATDFGLNPADLRRNVSFLIQGLVYPVAPLAQRLAAWANWNAEICLWLVALPAMGLLVWSGLRRDKRRGRGMFWLGLGWFALFALPPLVSMEADWFALAPRFLYMTAAGASLVWAAAASAWLARTRLLERAVIITVLIALLIPAGAFVRDGVRLYTTAGESLWDAVEAAAAAVRDRPILLVNLPMRITPRSRTYPLGFEGVTPLPTRVTAEGLVYTHTGIHDAAQAVTFGAVAPEAPPDYTYQLFGEPIGWQELAQAVQQIDAVYVTQYEPQHIHLQEAGGAGEVQANEPLARFGDRVALWELVCARDGGGRTQLAVTWQVEAAVETDALVFLHLLDAEGSLLSQADGHPLLGMLPFWAWQPGQVLRDARYLGSVPSGEYTVRVGLWEPTTGERWSVEGHPDGIVLLTVRCP